MHPVEHTVYFCMHTSHPHTPWFPGQDLTGWLCAAACALLPLVFRMHPVCFLFNLFHAAISPMAGHDGLTGEVGGGGYGHYLHHAHYEVNYGTVKVPLDRVLGTWANGWPRKKEGSQPPPPGVKEWAMISVPLLMLATAQGMAAGL